MRVRRSEVNEATKTWNTPRSRCLGGGGGWTDLGRRLRNRASRGGCAVQVGRSSAAGAMATPSGSSFVCGPVRAPPTGLRERHEVLQGAEEPLWKRPVSSCGRIAASGGVRSPSRACAVLTPGASATVDGGECDPRSRPRRLDPRSKIPSTGPRGHPVDNRESPRERVDLRRFPQSYAQRIHSCGEFARVGGAPC